MRFSRKQAIAVVLVLAAAMVGVLFLVRKTPTEPQASIASSVQASPRNEPVPVAKAIVKALPQSVSEVTKSRSPSETPKTAISGKYLPLEQEGFKKGAERLPIQEMPRATLGKSSYSVVRGLHASMTRLEHLNEVALVNGIYYYDAATERLPENAIFDRNVDKVGFWSGEVSVDGGENVVDEVTKKFDLELLNEEHGRAIFRAGPRFSLSSDYPALVKVVAPGQVRLDIRFSKMMRQ